MKHLISILFFFISINIYAQNADVTNLRVDHNVMSNSQKGMRIHFTLNVHNWKGRKINVCAFFYKGYDGDYGKLINNVNGYQASDGHLCTYCDATATYENSEWKDFKLFLPYSALPNLNGKAHYSFYVAVRKVTSAGTSKIGMSDWYNFQLTYGSSSNEYYAKKSSISQSASNNVPSFGLDNSRNYSSNSNSYLNVEPKLPKTFETPFPMGKLVTRVNEDGSVTQYSETRCTSCNNGVPGANAPAGFCQICKGARGRFLYGGLWNPCSFCAGTGFCPHCKGNGIQRMYYFQDSYGMTFGVDMNGNVFFPDVSSGQPGYRDQSHLVKVGEKEWTPTSFGIDTSEEWCEKCGKYRNRHVHVPVYRSR